MVTLTGLTHRGSVRAAQPKLPSLPWRRRGGTKLPVQTGAGRRTPGNRRSRSLSRPSPSANLVGNWKGGPLVRDFRGHHDLPNTNRTLSRPRSAGRRAALLGVMRNSREFNGSGWLKNLFIGKGRSLADQRLFHKVSLVAVLAWVGLGADGLSSSCYGPEETFKALGTHMALAPFVALACVVTIGVICLSYSQIIELFPGGGGGYLVASKLLGQRMGVVSGCALLVDYVLTIAISIASGADALFSVLPAAWLNWKMPVVLGSTALLTLLNLRGVRESVLMWVPVFFVFVATHGFAILFGIATHLGAIPRVWAETSSGLHMTHTELGWVGVVLLL